MSRKRAFENLKSKYCCEDISKIENYEKAKKDNFIGWCIHHRDEIKVLPSGITVIRSHKELIENGRYYDCPANELIFMKHKDHIALHGKYSFLGKHHKNRNTKNLRKPKSSFGIWFYETYKIRPEENIKLYHREWRRYKKDKAPLEGFFE